MDLLPKAYPGRAQNFDAPPVITLQFWEKAIPKADRLPLPLIIHFISNHVIQGFTREAEGGTPFGYLMGMIPENRRAWPPPAV